MKGFQSQRNALAAQEYLQRRSLLISKIVFFFVFFLVAFTGVAAYAVYTNLKRKYQCFIESVDHQQDFTACSGTRLAMCAEHKWFNALFACSGQTQLAEAAVYAFYSKDLHSRVCSYGVGKFLGNMSTALSVGSTTFDNGQLICIGLDIKPDDQNKNWAKQCYPTCKWQTNFPEMTGWDVASSSMSMGASLGMMGAMIPPPAGLITGALGFLGGALFGGIMGNRKLKRARNQALKQCQQSRQSCYYPPGLPACQK